jgi:hypothetical protein
MLPTHQLSVRCDLIRACPPHGMAQPSPVHQTTRSSTYGINYAHVRFVAYPAYECGPWCPTHIPLPSPGLWRSR